MHDQMMRLEAIRIDKGIKSVSEFCRIIGFKNRFYYSELLSAGKPFPPKYLISLYNELGVNLHWFLTGDGPMYYAINLIDHKASVVFQYKSKYGDDWVSFYDKRPILDKTHDEIGSKFLDDLMPKSDDEKKQIVSVLLKSPVFYSFLNPSTALHHYLKLFFPVDANDEQTLAKIAGELISIKDMAEHSKYRELLLCDIGFIVSFIINNDDTVFDIDFFLDVYNKPQANSRSTRKLIKTP